MTDSSYSGRQPNRTSYVKLFYGSNTGNYTTWVNTQYNSSNVLAPVNQKTNVYVYKDLIVGGSILNPSDSILKNNIEEISLNTANTLLDAIPKQYTFKKDTENNIHYGFIAQELEQIAPNLVNEIETPIDGKIKSVNYIEIIPLLLLKIKDLQNQIDDLKLKTDTNK
uniref:Peptidase S74 domain-containing protein n=1 Tax=viral metagenome TaxID=1070528 RepID=A0A6C0KXS8_9ZZZZ